MKIIILKHSYDNDDICECIASYFDKKGELVYKCNNLLYCQIRGVNEFKSHSKFFNAKIKKAVLCKIEILKKIGSKANKL